jgi:hypothetical protein
VAISWRAVGVVSHKTWRNVRGRGAVGVNMEDGTSDAPETDDVKGRCDSPKFSMSHNNGIQTKCDVVSCPGPIEPI